MTVWKSLTFTLASFTLSISLGPTIGLSCSVKRTFVLLVGRHNQKRKKQKTPGRPGGYPQGSHRSVLAQLRHTAPHVTFATGRHTEWIAIAGGSG